MTPEILAWFATVAMPYLQQPGRVLEVGARNINGSVRPLIEPLATEYIGTDMEAGDGVDVVIDNARLMEQAIALGFMQYDTIICCECLEHDVAFWNTVDSLQRLLESGGHLIITTPTYGFPVHQYPKDYWRFGEDAYREVFFRGFDILDLSFLDDRHLGRKLTLACIGRKP